MPVSHAHYCEHCDRTFTCRRNCGFAYDITKAHKCWQRKWYADKVREAIASQDTTEPLPFPRRSPLAEKIKPSTRPAATMQRYVPNYYDQVQTLQLRKFAGESWTVPTTKEAK